MDDKKEMEAVLAAFVDHIVARSRRDLFIAAALQGMLAAGWLSTTDGAHDERWVARAVSLADIAVRHAAEADQCQ